MGQLIILRGWMAPARVTDKTDGPALTGTGKRPSAGHLPQLRERFLSTGQDVPVWRVRRQARRRQCLRGVQLLRCRPLCQLQDRLGRVLTARGGLVLSDRYTTSNAVHQCSKLPPMHWDGFLNWLFDFEYKKFGIPAPDAVIYLAVDPDVSQKLITERYHGDETKKDIQEKDTEYMASQPRRRRVLRPHRWAGTALNAPSRQTAQNPCALSRISTPRYLRN